MKMTHFERFPRSARDSFSVVAAGAANDLRTGRPIGDDKPGLDFVANKWSLCVI